MAEKNRQLFLKFVEQENAVGKKNVSEEAQEAPTEGAYNEGCEELLEEDE